MLQCARQPLMTKNYLPLHVSGGVVEKPRFKRCEEEERKERKWPLHGEGRIEDREKETAVDAPHRAPWRECSPGVRDALVFSALL